MASTKERQDRKAEKEQKREEEQKKQKGPSLLEWIAAGIGALITLTLVGLIVLEAAGPTAPVPVLSIKPVIFAHERGASIVQVEVTNHSSETAASLNIEGELRRGGETVETSNATLAYLPGHSTRSAGIIFSRDPRAFDLSVRATGFEVP